MKSLFYLASAAVLVAVAAAGCGERKPEADVEITRFQINSEMLTADKNFRIVMSGDTVYLDQYVSLQWPVSLGGADIAPLQDSLIAYCFGDSAIGNPEDAIRRFVGNTSVFETADGACSVTPVDSLPKGTDGLRCYFNNVTARMIEVDEEKATFQVSVSSYLGGAHPFTAIHPLTYVFADGRVLDINNMFTRDGRDSIMPIVIEALARQLDVPVSRLDRAGIFTSQLTQPGMPYILNNTLYFHYNPYDIAPYSSGMIDVAVYPYEVERFLAPEVRALFDLGY